MTPRILDEELILAKLRMMRRLLDELEAISPVTPELLNDDFGKQLIVERVLSQLVDLACAINTHVATAELREAPHDLRRSFEVAGRMGMISKELAGELGPSTGMRNVLVHAYLDLDMDKFVAAAPHAITQYGDYVRQVANWLQQRQGS